MKKIVVSLLIIIALILLILYFFNPELLSKIWLWLVGLAGVIWAGLKKIGNVFGTKDIKAVESENQNIRNELDTIRQEIASTENRLKQERELHQRELAILNTKLELAEKQIAAERAYREKLQKMNYTEYKESLSSDEKEKFEQQIWDDVKF